MKLAENFSTKVSNQKKKKFRRQGDMMPIQVNTGNKIRPRKPVKTDSWHQRRCNYEVHLPSIGWIAVFLDPGQVNQLMAPGNTVREGCTLKYQHGRWYASVKIIRREVIHPGPGDQSSCGIDPGLDKLAAVSDGPILKNPRNLKYDDARNLALSVINLGEGQTKFLDKETRKQMSESVYRHDARQRRKVLTQCRQLAAKLCNQYDFIGIEANSGVALGIGSRFTGATKTLLQCLINRCGHNRVREVESYYNSQICSQCGHHDKIAWERKIGSKDQTCSCPSCGYTTDRDNNGARNVNRKLRKDLGLPDNVIQYQPCGA
jgi:transposase